MLIPLQDIGQAKAILWSEQTSPLVIFHSDPTHDHSKTALSVIRRLMAEYHEADYYHLNAKTHPAVSLFVRQVLKTADTGPHITVIVSGKTRIFAEETLRADNILDMLNNG